MSEHLPNAGASPPLLTESSILTIEQVAGLLHMHPVTVQRQARRGELPAFKKGKRWLFYQVDLIAFLRAQYSPRVMQGAHEEIKLCRSTNEKIHPSTGSSSLSAEKSYKKALGLPTS